MIEKQHTNNTVPLIILPSSKVQFHRSTEYSFGVASLTFISAESILVTKLLNLFYSLIRNSELIRNFPVISNLYSAVILLYGWYTFNVEGTAT